MARHNPLEDLFTSPAIAQFLQPQPSIQNQQQFLGGIPGAGNLLGQGQSNNALAQLFQQSPQGQQLFPDQGQPFSDSPGGVQEAFNRFEEFLNSKLGRFAVRSGVGALESLLGQQPPQRQFLDTQPLIQGGQPNVQDPGTQLLMQLALLGGRT